MITSGIIVPDSKDGIELGFTSDKFGSKSYLLKFEKYVYIIRIKNLKYFPELIEKACKRNLGIKYMGTDRKIIKQLKKHEFVMLTEYNHERRKHCIVYARSHKRGVTHEIEEYIKSIEEGVKC